tara:strand:+ start:12985 stop:13893 length:909 start_codon:yes stop_codon:yes gene_type:complete
MSIVLDGKKVANEIEQRLLHEINLGIKKVGRPPGLAVIRVGDDPASGVYVRNKEKACMRIGIKGFGLHLPENTSTEEIIAKIDSLNRNENVDGILLQLPLPEGINESLVLNAINPDKDADGLHPLNLGKLLKGDQGPRSCTPAGVLALLSSNKIPIEGKRAVVVGRSILVGQPMALMLQAANATVTIAHSRTRDLCELTQQAELLIVAAGKPNLIGYEHVQNQAIVIDVGIHRIRKKVSSSESSSYYLCGDVKFEEIISKTSAISPVPGGVGPMTVTMLLVNTVSSWQQHCGLSFTLSDLLP